MTQANDHEDQISPPTRRSFRSRTSLALAAAGLVVLGGAAGAAVVAHSRAAVAMAPATPTAIRALTSDGIVTIRGRVVEIYGNKVIVADATGRALVDFGREGNNAQLASVAEPVTVQGRFERGIVHAAFLVGPDNKVIALEPLGGPPHHHHGPRDDREPDGQPLPHADAPPGPAPSPGVAAHPATQPQAK